MTPFDYDKASIRMDNQAFILDACSAALRLDFVPAPVILATDDPIMDIANIHRLSSFLGLDAVEIGLGETSLENLKYLVDGDTGFYVVNGYDDNAEDKLVSLLEIINGRVFTPAIVMVVAGLRHEESVLTAFQKGLGIHRAHVPVARVSLDKRLKQPVLLVGHMSLEGSKCGRRFMSIDMLTPSAPYEHNVRFTIQGKDDQSDDDINEILSAIEGRVAVRLTDNDGELECSLDDIEGCE